MSSVMFEDINSSLKMLEMAFESSYNPIVITDAMLEEPGPRFVYVNPAFTKMTGWELEEIVDKTPRILQGKKSDRATLDELKKRCKKGEYFSGRTTNYKKDGSEYIVEWNISPVFSKDGEIVYYLSFQKDVTSEVQARKKEDEFMKFQGMAMKAVGITHILNTELTKIKGRLELVEMVVKSSSLRLYDELEADLEPLRQALRNIGFLSASIRCLSDVKDESKESVDVVEVLLEAIRYKDIDSEGLEIFIDKINYKKPYSLDIYTHKRSLFMV
ncbi:MAG: PAS domain-containing protein, partial [Campylobacterales bacterium]